MVGLAALLGSAVIALVLWDAFETILLPRRVPSQLRFSRFVLRGLWWVWGRAGARIERRSPREDFLAVYALLALILLLMVWAAGLLTGFAALLWASGSRVASERGTPGLFMDLYLSGTTLFTLGLGDVVPTTRLSRALVVIEAGTGFGFLALTLAYVPVIYTAFSRRETRITTLDEWAGSPPSAGMLLRRCFESRVPPSALNRLFADWELGAAETLESHLSYPILVFFRSQHDNQSWLGAMTAVLDACALTIVGIEGVDPFQARMTFAICRHTLVDLSQSARIAPLMDAAGSAPDSAALAEARDWLRAAGVGVAEGEGADRRFRELRELYVPYARALSNLLLMPLPELLPPAKARFNWETTAWARTRRLDLH